MPYVNNKGADQSVHLRSLISFFVVRCLDSIIPLLAITEISRSVWSAEQAGLSHTWPQTQKTGFLVTRLIYCVRETITWAFAVHLCDVLFSHDLARIEKNVWCQNYYCVSSVCPTTWYFKGLIGQIIGIQAEVLISKAKCYSNIRLVSFDYWLTDNQVYWIQSHNSHNQSLKSVADKFVDAQVCICVAHI